MMINGGTGPVLAFTAVLSPLTLAVALAVALTLALNPGFTLALILILTLTLTLTLTLARCSTTCRRHSRCPFSRSTNYPYP